MTLAVVLEHAQQRRDVALAALRRAEEQLRRAEQQASQLHGYRGQYHARWGDRFGSRGEMEIVHCYRDFAQRLDEAVAQQQQQLGGAAAHCERLRRQLLAAEMRVAAVQKLMQRRAGEAARTQERDAQRQRDDAAQQRHWHARQAAATET